MGGVRPAEITINMGGEMIWNGLKKKGFLGSKKGIFREARNPQNYGSLVEFLFLLVFLVGILCYLFIF